MGERWYYVWVDEDCPDKTNDIDEAIRWRDEFRAEGHDSYIVNEDNEMVAESSW